MKVRLAPMGSLELPAWTRSFDMDSLPFPGDEFDLPGQTVRVVRRIYQAEMVEPMGPVVTAVLIVRKESNA